MNNSKNIKAYRIESTNIYPICPYCEKEITTAFSPTSIVNQKYFEKSLKKHAAVERSYQCPHCLCILGFSYKR